MAMKRSNPSGTRWIALTASAIVFVVVASIILRRHSSLFRPREEDIVATAFAAADHRMIVPRISGVSEYRPFRSSTRGVKVWNGVEPGGIRNPHVRGLLHLLAGDSPNALKLLRRAAEDRTGTFDLEKITDAALLTDLAAAHYEQASRDEQPAELVFAVSASARAVELAPGEPSGWFVLALTLEALHLREDAIESWKAHLSCDSTSGWASEAREHLVSLERTVPKDIRRLIVAAAAKGDSSQVEVLTAQAPQQARIAVEEDLLGSWARAVRTAKNDAAHASLSQAMIIAAAICRGGGDCAALDAATLAGNKDYPIETIARAHATYSDARVAFGLARDMKARDALIDAARLLDQIRSPLSARAWVYAATVTHYLGANDMALALLERAHAALHGREQRNPLAFGQALWTRGLIDFARGLPHQSLLSYNAARAHLARARESSNIAGIEAVLAEAYRYIGDPENAWTHHLLTLQALARDATYMRRQIAYSDIATAAMEMQQLRFASLIARRILLRARADRDSVFEASALYTMSRIDVTRNDNVAARAKLEDAARLLEPIEPNGTTMRLIADIAIGRGEVLTTIDARAALTFLGDAHRRLASLDHHSRLLRVHLLAARAHATLSDAAAQKRELYAGLEELERQRRHLASAEERSTFTDTGRALYDALVHLLLSEDRAAEALAVVRRARTLGLTVPDSVVSSADLRAIPSVEPNGSSIEYYVLPHALVTWRTTRTSMQVFEKLIERKELETAIESGVEAIRNCARPEECVTQSAALYDLLVRAPLASVDEQAILIAPDGPLHRVPFAALYDNATHQHLIEQYQLTIALGCNAAAPRERPYETILVAVASNPSGSLPALRSALREGNRAARHFARAKILSGADATAERMLDTAGAYDVVHFAGHAEANERQPRLSTLRCAPSPARAHGALYAWEIAAQPLPKTRLAVLAACDTANGRLVNTGLLSFARSFIAAGVPRVVGTLWAAEDDASAELFSRFYAALSAGVGSSAALRQAQRAAIASREFNGPSDWATFQIYTSW